MKKTKIIFARVDPALHHRLQEVKRVLGVSSSAFVRMAVTQVLAQLYNEEGYIKDEYVHRAEKLHDHQQKLRTPPA